MRTSRGHLDAGLAKHELPNRFPRPSDPLPLALTRALTPTQELLDRFWGYPMCVVRGMLCALEQEGTLWRSEVAKPCTRPPSSHTSLAVTPALAPNP